MEGHADSQSRTGQRGAGRKVAEVIAESKIQMAFQSIVDLGGLIPNAPQVEARGGNLDTE